MVYKCFFDGSYTAEISGCAFCVIVGDKIVDSCVFGETLPSSHYAETMSLALLLRYIGQYIDPGSTVEIYGDDKSLIDMILHHRDREYKDSWIRHLYDGVKLSRSISLTYIPKEKNKVAHNLSRTIYKTHPMCVERKYISLDDIIIPKHVKRCILPEPKSYTKRLLYAQKHGCDHKSKIIRINSIGQMISGYTTYLILKDSGVTSCYVEVYSRKMDLEAV